MNATIPAGDDEPGLLEDAQVLHDAEPRHLESAFELAERAPVFIEESVEKMPPGRVRKRLEDLVVVIHPHTIRDQMVTCQAHRSSGNPASSQSGMPPA